MHLSQLVDQFATDERLNEEPSLLGRNSTDNARAVTHAMRLASYDYPRAYGRGHKSFPFEKFYQSFHLYNTLAVGFEHRLDGGVMYSHVDQSQATIDYIFRFRDSTRACGRMLLMAALTNLENQGDYDCINLEVVSNNVAARSLYEAVGFQVVGSVSGTGHKIVNMELDSSTAILRAIDMLHDTL